MIKMSVKDQRRLVRLLEDRRRAGEDIVSADEQIRVLLREHGVNWADCEYGLNSVFLITEPATCETFGRRSIEEELGYELED